MKGSWSTRSEVRWFRFAQRAQRLLILACSGFLLLLSAGCDTSAYSPPDPNATSSTSIASTTTSAPAVTTSASAATTTASSTTTIPPTTTTAPTTTTTLGAAAPGTVLYEITDWSTGMEGWAATGQWKTVSGMLVSDGSNDSIAVAPVDLGNTADYAVEAEIQVLHPGQVRCYLEGRLINGDGYYGGYQGWGDEMQIGFAGDRISAADFSINTDWHTYRFEVSGNTMTLFFDGAEVVRAMDNRRLEPGTVGVFCSGQINVRAFRVIAL